MPLAIRSLTLAALLMALPFALEAPGNAPVLADAIVILGGGTGDRLVKAVELYKAGYAKQFIVTGFGAQEASNEKKLQDPRVSELVWRYGVSLERIFCVQGSTNSWLEAQQTLKLMKSHQWQTVIVVSDPPHMLRLSFTWSKLFRAQRESFALVPTQPSWWKPWLWWANFRSFAFVFSEISKLVYYVTVY